MKKQKNKQAKKASKLAKAENLKQKTITVKNAEGEPDTEAVVLVQNKIDYTPKVSVIIPVYNVEQYLRECLNSVIKQTLKEIEIICVDDGSTDNSLDILKEYAEKDHRITIITQKNLHAGVARNAGLAIAKGEYLSFLDSDDFFELNMLEEMYKKAIDDGSDVVLCGNYVYDSQAKKILKQNHINKKYVLSSPFSADDYDDSLFIICNPNPWNKLVKKELYVNSNVRFERFIRCNDFTCVCTILSIAKKISAIDEPYITYRTNQKYNVSAKRNKHVDCFLYAADKLEKNLKRLYTYDTCHNTMVTRLSSSLRWELSVCSSEEASLLRTQAKNILSENLYNELFEPKVSVIIPIYNTEQYLSQCLDSIINQTLKEIEIICVNDGSTDNSLEILKKYSSIDNRIVIINQKNQGLSCSRNNAMKIAKGEYIQFVDSDDWLEPESLDLLYKKSKKLDLDMLCFEGQNYENGQFYQSKGLMIDYASDEGKVYLSQDMPAIIPLISISACLVFYKHSFLANEQITFPEHVLFEDNYFMHLALNKSSRFGILKRILYNRRKHSSQITAHWDDHYGDYIKIVNMMIKLYTTEYVNNNELSSNIINKYCTGLVYRYNTLQNKVQYWEVLIKLFNSIPQNIILSEYVIKFIENLKTKKDYKIFLRHWYMSVTGKYLNLDRPQTYNEKLQWLKIYNALPIKTRLADKYLVRDWVKEKIGEQYLVPLLGVYDKFADIDFAKLPNQFVIKCNHGCGWNIIVTNKSKLDLNDAKAKFNRWMDSNLAFKFGYELHYRDIQPKIIIEKYIDPQVSNHEIQVWCFNGKIQFVSVESIKDTDNLVRGTFYPDGTRTKFEISPQHYKKLESIPSMKAFNKALELAKKMLIDVPYVRIDFIEYKDDVRFREMTFTSGSGLSAIKPDEYNLFLGNLIKLPKLAYDIDSGKYYKLPKKSRVLPWLALPFNFLRVKYLQHQFNKLQVKQIYKQLSSFRVDAKNFGTADNTLAVIAPKTKVSTPAWFANAQGKGIMIEGAELKQSISLKAIKSGKLQLTFKGSDRRANNVRYPLWIDYKSIKIDGKEILSSPVATWHDKPFKYEMPVKDGQVVKIAFEQQPHQYAKSELKDVILKLNQNNNYIKTNIDKIVTKVAKTYAKPLTLKPEVKPAEVKASPEEVERQKVLNLLQQSLAASQTLSKEISNLKGQIESLQKEVKTLKTEQVTTQKMLVNEQTLLQKRRKLN